MTKKIIILNGSPRLKGNTMALCQALEAGAREAGHDVQRFDLQKMKISGCIGCMKGGKDRLSPCTIKDDMDKIYPAYEAADIVVLASPMYYWTISGQLKCAFDRLFAVAECNPDYANPVKECAFLMAAEDNSPENWEAVNAWHGSLLKFLKWKDRGFVRAGGFMDAGAINGSPAIEMAKELGASL